MTFERNIVDRIAHRMSEPRRFIQIVVGPRQTGKTTAVRQALAKLSIPHLVAEATKHESNADWLRANWYRARQLADDDACALLVVDEIQYVQNWSGIVKTLWDEDTAQGLPVKVLLTGSSSTLIQEGLHESLMGRFELIECTHWTFDECKEAFGYSLDDFLLYGGYPGAAPLIDEPRRWLSYMRNSVIEPSITNDALMLADVRKPELMRRLFSLGAPYSAQEISYRKILGQLDDRGNTETIARYLSILGNAGIMSGIHKYDPKLLRERSSSPRLLVHDTGLMSAAFGRRRSSLLTDPELKGHLVESAVGAYLLNRSYTGELEVFSWREMDRGKAKEVDFVVESDGEVTAIEVKSGRVKGTDGLTAFLLRYPQARTLVVGSPDCPLESFLSGAMEV